VDARLVKGKDGVFEVDVDGKRVYSKRSTGRFPELGEVSRIIREL
jgi:selenoprotein W-related protein